MTGKWFDQLCIVILENHGFDQVKDCQFTKWFADNGTIFTNWHGQQHPSGPNYRTLFSGIPWSSNEFDNCWRPSILDEIASATVSFAGQPANRHNPVLDMNSKKGIFVGQDDFKVIQQWPPIVYLGMDDDSNCHDGSLEVADHNVIRAIDWWKQHIPNALFVLTFDEAFGLEYISNHVFSGMAGPMVRKGTVNTFFTHSDFARGLYENWTIPYHNSDGTKSHWALPMYKPWWQFP